MPAVSHRVSDHPAPTWDVFCRVIDNHGDVGVCWRLARSLRARGIAVRLWVDDASALSWMAPAPLPPWVYPFGDAHSLAHEPEEVGDVVIEAFGCDPPEGFVQAMTHKATAPVWINLEYLSAENYVERSHALPSPQTAGAGRGLTKWFFYPGFTARTGGLLRCPDLRPWEAPRRSNERVVSVLAYENAGFASLLDSLGAAPTLLALWPGPSQKAVRTLIHAHPHRWPLVRCLDLPWMSQAQFDGVLQASDLNVVRGEDSLVSAVNAGRPFVWQAYVQHDGAHRAKLLALWDLIERANVVPAVAPTANASPMPGNQPALAQLRRGWLAFNCLGDAPTNEPVPWDAGTFTAWSRALAPWFAQLQSLPPLDQALAAFAQARQSPPPR